MRSITLISGAGKAYCIMKESGIEKAMNASAGTIAGRDSARNGQMLHGAMISYT